jgi:hypothetical protein
MAFQLDTSGEVPTDYNPCTKLRWSDLSHFAQGHVEAMFEDIARVFGTSGNWSFADLAPETLARIIADCASFENIVAGLGRKSGTFEGHRFWNGRQGGLSGSIGAAFPPLDVQLGDDGKVRFA